MALQVVDASKLIAAGLQRLLDVLKKRAHEFKTTIAVGRTHGIHAEPTTFGLKLALWYDEVRRQVDRFHEAAETMRVGKLSGAVGTFAHLSPEIEEESLRKLALKPANVATQVIQRDRYAHYISTLALIGATLEKIATEVRHLQRTEVREAEEYFSPGQKGSSAMPHKRNPITSEQISGLARLLRSNAMAAMENVALWHERDISHSSVERIIFPDSTILADYLLDKTATLIEKLVVYPKRMAENLELTHGLVYSGELLLELVGKGITREDAYRWVQRNAMRVWDEGGTFKEKVLSDSDIVKACGAKEIEKVFDSSRLLKNVDRISSECLGKRETSWSARLRQF
jgi:adenylosuccinate lyase